MKKLTLLNLTRKEDLSSDQLKRIKGGSCRAWSCQCNLTSLDAQNVDDTLEYRDKFGEM